MDKHELASKLIWDEMCKFAAEMFSHEAIDIMYKEGHLSRRNEILHDLTKSILGGSFPNDQLGEHFTNLSQSLLILKKDFDRSQK